MYVKDYTCACESPYMYRVLCIHKQSALPALMVSGGMSFAVLLRSPSTCPFSCKRCKRCLAKCLQIQLMLAKLRLTSDQTLVSSGKVSQTHSLDELRLRVDFPLSQLRPLKLGFVSKPAISGLMEAQFGVSRSRIICT